MTDNSAMMKSVLLKNGTMLDCTVAQLVRINMAILSTHDFEKIQVKLQGVYFKLGDLETNPEKLANARQQGLPIKLDPVHKKRDMS